MILRTQAALALATPAAAMPVNLVSALDALAAAEPKKPLYHFYDSRGRECEAYDRASFQRRSCGIARGLREEAGIVPGDRIVLAHPPGIEFAAAFFAALRVGAIPVPTPPLGANAVRSRVTQIIGDCAPVALLTRGCEVHEALPCFDTSRWPDASVDDVPALSAGAEDIAFLQYTSGSTSAPKGVVVTHGNILHNWSIVVDHADPVSVSWLPQHHDMGLIGYFLYPALSGGIAHCFAPSAFMARPALWLELMTRHRATATSAPNFAFDYVLDKVDEAMLATVDLSHLRFLMAAAEPVRPRTYQRFLRTMAPRGLSPEAFYVAYGLAEATLAVTSYGRRQVSLARNELARGRARETRTASGIAQSVRLMTCGRPLGDMNIVIVDPRTRTPLPEGAVGEVWVAGASVASGYWNRPDATLSTFGNRLSSDASTAYLATGDLGFLRDGELVLCGRSRDVMIVRGQNIYPQDIETSVERSIAGARPGSTIAFITEPEDGPAQIIVAIEAGRGRCDLAEAARQVRADQGVEIDQIWLLGPRAIPRTSSGKPMRFRARELFESGEWTPIDRYVRPARASDDDSPLGWLLERYQLNGTETASLAEIGVDSLDLVGLIHQIQELLAAHGTDHAEQSIDAQLVQRLTVCELVGMADLFRRDPEMATRHLQAEIGRVRAAAQELEQIGMAADARLLPCLPRPLPPVPDSADRDPILLTGATGFLGPFLLAAAARDGAPPIRALVRAPDAETAKARMLDAVRRSGLDDETVARIDRITEAVPGDLALPGLGLRAYDRDRLAAETGTIFHNGALVNYLFDYRRMREANVAGTLALLDLAGERRTKIFNHVSTTFVFGWATKPVLYESDCNAGMELLDFGYSQTKWSSEQIVLNAAAAGLPTRIFRPALLTPAADGGGNAFDITIRLLKFMLDHGIGVSAQNQVSFTPADVAANNIVAIASLPDTIGQTFHVVRDEYSTMKDVTDRLAAFTGRPFTLYPLEEFVPEVLRRCTRDDILFPLLDFLINSIDNISSMEFKRYESSGYQAARDRSAAGRPDPSLDDTVRGILRFMERQGLN